MDSYTEFSNKGIKKEIKFVGEKNNERLYSGWEINQVNAEINTFYHKNELLNTIKTLLLEGAEPQNIWIFNKSVSVNKQYVMYPEGNINIQNTSAINNLFYLGDPISLEYSEKVRTLNLYFSTYREIYSYTNGKKEIKNLPKTEILRDIYQNIFVEKKLHVNGLQNYFISKINEINTGVDIKDLQKIDEILIRKMKENTKESFYDLFNRLDRPTVVYKENQRIQILCSELVVHNSFQKINGRFLETKHISQNSPLEIVLGMSVTVLPSLIKIIKYRRDLYLANQDEFESNNELEQELEDINLKILELDNLIEEMNNQQIRDGFNPIEEPVNLRFETEIALNDVEVASDINNKKLANSLENNSISIENIQAIERN